MIKDIDKTLYYQRNLAGGDTQHYPGYDPREVVGHAGDLTDHAFAGGGPDAVNLSTLVNAMR